ncbi:hypothetical protein [Microbulbifer sp. JMSA008]|uniref:hypothetical protein n=1 Tax=Microbulbifer sp. JMSA008 TaxID=3243373 RepID=UPI00403A3AEF
MSMPGYLEENRKRLINLLAKIQNSDCPEGWERVGGIAIRGFIGFGFSKEKSNLALIVSTSGRSLINCDSAEKVARDYEEFVGIDDSGIFCEGIGELSEERILIAGQNGGGLPSSTCIGESLICYSPNWPQHDLYFCDPSADPLSERFQDGCIKLRTDFIEAFGFSWCGDYFAVASNCDFDIWKRK